MRAPFKGASILLHLSDRVDSGRITSVHPDGSVSLVYFPSLQSATNFQSRHRVLYGPGKVGCWSWNHEAEGQTVYTQEKPSSIWTISHGKGKYQQVTCFNQSGDRIEADESQPNTSQVILRFSPAIAGFAILR